MNALTDKALNKVKGLRIGFYLLVVALATAIAGLVLFLQTYEIFGYKMEKWGISLTVLGAWLIAALVANAFYGGNNPKWSWVFYGVAIAFLVVAMIMFITPVLSPIGIYFTVNNMGDVEANALGVPRSIAAAACYVVSALCIIVASFTKTVKD